MRTRAEILRQTRRIAVVGLTPGRESEGVAVYMRDQGYEIVPVNPQFPEVMGERSYPDLASVSGPIDLVNIFRRSEYVGLIMEEAIRVGAKAVWMQLSVTNEQAAQAGAKAGLDVVMDTCIHCEHKKLREAGEL